jgi:multidrug efflux pump subunit AcrB
MPGLLKKYPGVSVLWQGQQERTTESMDSLVLGLFVALVAMFVLLTVEFKSYAQPLIVMTIIPFGVIGAVWGHFLQGMEMTMFSLFGVVALTGVVVNDAIVLIDFINRRISEGLPLKEALIGAGTGRLRAVFLTSVTTIAGLAPILLERSFQAQIVIPMATSLCFGLAASTFLVLFLAPSLYFVYALLTGVGQPLPETPLEPPGKRVEHQTLQPPVEVPVAGPSQSLGGNGDDRSGNGDGASSDAHRHPTETTVGSTD